MELKLEINSKAVKDNQPLAYAGIMITPNINENYWIMRVKVNKKQAVVAFPKFGTIGIGFMIEARDWNTNLPWCCNPQTIYDHIKDNKGGHASPEDCIKAIKMLRQAISDAKLDPKNSIDNPIR